MPDDLSPHGGREVNAPQLPSWAGGNLPGRSNTIPWTIDDYIHNDQMDFGPGILAHSSLFSVGATKQDEALVSDLDGLRIATILCSSQGWPAIISTGASEHALVIRDVDLSARQVRFFDGAYVTESLLSEGKNTLGIAAVRAESPGEHRVSIEEWLTCFVAIFVPLAVWREYWNGSEPKPVSLEEVSTAAAGAFQKMDSAAQPEDEAFEVSLEECCGQTGFDVRMRFRGVSPFERADLAARVAALESIVWLYELKFGVERRLLSKAAMLFGAMSDMERWYIQEFARAQLEDREMSSHRAMNVAYGRAVERTVRGYGPAPMAVHAFLSGRSFDAYYLLDTATLKGWVEDALDPEGWRTLSIHGSHFPCLTRGPYEYGYAARESARALLNLKVPE